MGVQRTREIFRKDALEWLCNKKAEARIKIATKQIKQDIMWEIEQLTNEQIADLLEDEWYNWSVLDDWQSKETQ